MTQEEKNGRDNFIKELKAFVDLTEDQCSFIYLRLHNKSYAKSEYIFQEGQVCNVEMYITKGLLRTFFTVDGIDRISHFSYEGHWVCDYSSFVDQSPAKSSVQAIEDTNLVCLYRKDEKDIRNYIPEWEKVSNMFLQRLVIQKDKLTTKLMTFTPERQYEDLLQNRPHLIQRVPQYYLAQYIGVQPESLSRIKKRLQQK